MTISAGTRLGLYEITAPLGAGGMGEVYRARDTKLGRSVAVKVLLEALASDPDRIARFEREAKVLASLNHPHIAALYGMEEDGGRHFLVMELVEGETLAERLQRGPMSVESALGVAQQIVEALEAAHEKSIVHRDLKPANVKITPDENVKVLDFGLAKAMETEPVAANLTHSPTLSMMATQAGVILGTAAYMSPEQAKGLPADHRSDVFSFGVVLYEMLTGRQPFHGETAPDILASVLAREADLQTLPTNLNPRLLDLVRRCLEKIPKRRWQAIGDLRAELDTIALSPRAVPAATQVGAASHSRWKIAIAALGGAVAAIAVAGIVMWNVRPTTPLLPVTRFAFTLDKGQRFTTNYQALAISPDGTQIVYVADRQLYIRSMSDLRARPIPGMQQMTPASTVFSPDSRSIAFYDEADHTIKKIAVSGGAAVTICSADIPFFDMDWDTSGIVFGQGRKGIMRVSANGGQPEQVVGVKDGELAHGPQVLPGGEWMLLTIATTAASDGWDKAQIVAQSLKSGERRTLVSGGSHGRYVPSGHLVYALGGVLLAVSLDLPHLAVKGEPVPIVEGVRRSVTKSTGAAHFSISNTGSLAFIPGPVSTSSAQSDLALIDRNGSLQPLKLPSGPYEYPRMSPDGKRVAFSSDEGKEASVWIYDLSGATSMRRLTLGSRNRFPIWSPDGERVAFQSDRGGGLALFWQRVDGTSAAERLTKPDHKDSAHVAESWSPDSKTLLFSIAKGSSYSVAALSLPDRNVTTFGDIHSPYPPAATFSPDGRWVAYSAGEPEAGSAGRLFVQPFPATGAMYPAPKGAGIHPMWSPDGKELIYSLGPRLAAVPVTTRPTFTFGNQREVTTTRFIGRGPLSERNHDMALDGKLLGVVATGPDIASRSGSAQVQVVLNWMEELKQRVPVK